MEVRPSISSSPRISTHTRLRIAMSTSSTTSSKQAEETKLRAETAERVLRAVSTSSNEAERKLRAAFAKFDLNDDGVLTLPELRAVLTRPGGGQPMTDEQIQKLFKTMDVDGDGKVNLDEFSKALTSGKAKVPVDPLAVLDSFEYSAPMLLMPFLRFKEQERIFKSTKTWRDEALSKGWLVEYDEASGKIVIFVSHTWWDREFTDKTNDKTDKYDRGAPDYQLEDYPDEERDVLEYGNGEPTGEKETYQKPKDLKWRVICAGVEELIEEQGLKAEDVMLWVDWQSIYQDEKEEKMKGVRSLIKYATLSDYMLVPTEEKNIVASPDYPERIPGYGSRGWCRCEYFIFSLAAEMRGREAQLYAIERDGSLWQFPKVKVDGKGDMPSQGALSNPNDKALVQDLEDKMIEAYVPVIVESMCKAGAGGEVNLQYKMIRDSHAKALCEAVNKYEVKRLFLDCNQLGDAGAEAIAAMLRTNRSVTYLSLGGNQLGDAGAEAIAAMLRTNRSLTDLNLARNKIGDAGAEAIAAMLRTNHSLTELDLYGNKIGDAGAEAIAAMLRTNRSVTSLNLGSNKIGDAGAEAIAAMLRTNRSLTYLSLEDNKIGDAGEKAVREAVEGREGFELEL